MSELKQITQDISVNLTTKINSVCSPLKQLGLSLFAYHIVNAEGKMCIVCNRPEFAEYCASEEYAGDDPLLQPQVLNLQGHCLWSSLKASFKQTQIERSCFDIDHGVSIIKKADHGKTEIFSFAAPRKNYAVYSMYLNEMFLLSEFANYFKKEAQDITNKMNDSLISYFQSNDSKILTNRAINDKIIFLQSINVLPKNIDLYNLTKPELEYLNLVSEQKTAKQISICLHKSQRTIEHYAERLKEKFNCYSRSQFILMVQQLKKSGLLYNLLSFYN
ncbi:helix-turn-helix domain-containing protein [Piscirickettsia litoralis]|uniref:HTH luxR-type domain-containing protein n=1 Tax=Piscirickettsia litoralis TaxID=1891921 RepID=A0ABX3A4S9_9GAMM|nr:helix-turn-helix transcriptional regulator [Piscirickettsia litoralis]ODN42445.1 hypothetical protein BGC07_05240 [Piscirickettsia litoralis]